jgi:hypothetical protein
MEGPDTMERPDTMRPEYMRYENKNSVDLTKVKIDENYFYIPKGGITGRVTIMSDDLTYGIWVKYANGRQDIIFEHEKDNKKLYKIIEGGKRTRRRNKKNNKTKKSRRKSNRRKR